MILQIQGVLNKQYFYELNFNSFYILTEIFCIFSGAIGARLSSDASTVKALVGDALALIAQNIATIIAGLIIGFTANWKLALLILAVSPLMIMQGVLQTKFLKGFSADAKVNQIFPHELFKLQIECAANDFSITCRLCMKKQAKWQMMQLVASELLHHFVLKRR